MSIFERFFKNHRKTKQEKPFWISFHGDEPIMSIRARALNAMASLDHPNPQELVSECYVESEGRRFTPDNEYRTKPGDQIFFPRVAAAVDYLRQSGL